MLKRVLSSFVMIVLLVGAFFLNKTALYWVLSAIAFIGAVEIWKVNRHKHRRWQGFYFSFIYPTVYVSATLVWVVGDLRWKDSGWWLIMAIAGAASYDVVAMLVGRAVGSHQIAPKISPNKTWEGTGWGLCGPVMVAAIIGTYFFPLNRHAMLLLGLMMGLLAFLGDLVESWYKRRLGVKDMGSIIPGHGGLLDRIDSHLLVFWGVFIFQAGYKYF